MQKFITFAVLFLTLLGAESAAANLKVSLAPTQAVTAGARWRVDGGAWQTSGSTVKSLSNGSHWVEFKDVSGWLTPTPRAVTLSGGNTSLSVTYSLAASLRITLTPATAQWRINGGAWLASDAVAPNLAAGSYQIDYSAQTGYTAPAPETLTLAAGQNLSVQRSYVAWTGRLAIDAFPAPAKTTGAARFRVNGGAWQPCGATELTLNTGTYTVEFEDQPHWVEPESRTVTIDRDATTSLVVPYGYRHRLRFFLDPALTTGLSDAELRTRLSRYTAHLQTIFHRESSRRLVFDPATDITLTTTSPFSGVYYGTVPQLGYEVWVHAQLTQNPAYGTYGGYGSIDISGAGGGAGLYWDKIHDPAAVVDGSSDAMQYWRQIDHITHELEHTFGAGLGEYYSGAGVKDLTGVEPVLPPTPSVNVAATYPFWGEHTAYFGDPLMANAWANPRVGSPTSIATLLEVTRFGPATVGVLDGLYRFDSLASLPDLSQVSVRVVDAAGNLIPNASVRIWERPTPSATTSPAELVVSATTTPGSFLFSWAPYPNVSVSSNYHNMKLVKAYAPGYTPHARWIWLYTAQAEKTLLGSNTFTVTMVLDAQ